MFIHVNEISLYDDVFLINGIVDEFIYEGQPDNEPNGRITKIFIRKDDNQGQEVSVMGGDGEINVIAKGQWLKFRKK